MKIQSRKNREIGTLIAKNEIGAHMKKYTSLVILSLGLVLTACNDTNSTKVVLPEGGAPAAVNATTHTEPTGGSPKLDVSTDMAGTSSGGGGFADGYAMDSLNIVKYSLSQIIENASDEVFINLPEGKRKDWIVNIIRNIEYRDVEVSRYGRPLKFDYNVEEEKIYATRYFSSTFPYGRFFTKPTIEKLGVLTEVYLDVLHELSHFYGVGVTEETDPNSEYWAIDFMQKGLDELYFCKSGATTTAIHRNTGVAQLIEFEVENEEMVSNNEAYFMKKSGSFFMPWFLFDDGGNERVLHENVYEAYVSAAMQNKDLDVSSIYGQYIQSSAGPQLIFTDFSDDSYGVAESIARTYEGYILVGSPKISGESIVYYSEIPIDSEYSYGVLGLEGQYKSIEVGVLRKQEFSINETTGKASLKSWDEVYKGLDELAKTEREALLNYLGGKSDASSYGEAQCELHQNKIELDRFISDTEITDYLD